MLIVSANSQNDIKSYKEYIRYTDKKKSKHASMKLSAIICLILSVVLIIAFATVGPNAFLYVVLAVDVLCAIGMIFLKFIAPRIEFKKLGKNFTLPQTFNFKDNILELIVHSDKDILSRIPYVKILKVMDSPTAFYIYIAEKKALILNKSALQPNECDKIVNLLKQKNVKVIK